MICALRVIKGIWWCIYWWEEMYPQTTENEKK